MKKLGLGAPAEQMIKLVSAKKKYQNVSLRPKEKARFLMQFLVFLFLWWGSSDATLANIFY